jgi:uncharacterized protein (TIRG00374 family)
MRRWVQFVIQLLVGLILIGFWLHVIDVSEVWMLIKQVNVTLMAIGLFFFTLSYFIRSFRWHTILRQVRHVPVWTAFKVFMAGNLVNYLIPIRIGELAKSLLLKKMKGVRVAQSLPTVFFDKIADLFPIVPILVVLILLPIRFTPVLWTITITVFLLFFAALFVFYMSMRYNKAFTRLFMLLFFWMSPSLKKSIEDFLSRFFVGFSVMSQHPLALVWIAALTMLAVLSDTFYFWLVFLAFGHTINFFIVMLGYTLLGLSFILPTPPGHIGSNEVVLLLIFTVVFGVDKNLVSAVTALVHFLTGAIVIIIGLYAFSSLGWDTSWFKIKNE